MSNADIVEELRRRHEALRAEADADLAAGRIDHGEYLALLSSVERLGWLVRREASDELSPEKCHRLLARWWTLCDHIRPFRDEALMMFRDLVERIGIVADAPVPVWSDVIEVFRGATTEEVGSNIGISWTLDRDIARRFLGDRIHLAVGGTPVVLRARIPRECVLGWFVGRGEAEVILDPDELVDFRVLDVGDRDSACD